MKEILRPCPFCGSTVVGVRARKKIWTIGKVQMWYLARYWYVECLDCDARTGVVYRGDVEKYQEEEQVIKKWNLRTSEIGDAEKINYTRGTLIDIRWQLNQAIADTERAISFCDDEE